MDERLPRPDDPLGGSCPPQDKKEVRVKPGWEIASGAAAGLVLLAAACGATAEQAGRDQIPLAAGNRWSYELKKTGTLTLELPDGPRTVPTGTRGTSLERVIGEDRETFGVPTTVLQATVSERPMRGEPRSHTSQSYWRRTPQGLVGYGHRSSGMQGVVSETLERYPKPALLFKLPLAARAKWPVGTIGGAGLTMSPAAEVSGPATVRVPAGKSRGCWKVTYRYHGVRGRMSFPKAHLDVEDGSGVHTIWIAPGVGSVKEVETLRMRVVLRPQAGGTPVPGEGSTTSVKELTSYRVARERRGGRLSRTIGREPISDR
jgi:hypothetical protein